MASIISVNEIMPGRSASINSEWKREYKRVWRVVTDDARVGPLTAREAIPVGLADVYSTGLESDSGAYCLQVDVAAEGDDGKSWLVTASYGYYNPANRPANPLLKPIEVSWSTAQFERVAELDQDGNPIINSAGDFYDPPVTCDDSRPILSIKRNEATFNDTLADQYRDSINSDPFWNRSPYECKCHDIQASQSFDADFGWYWTLNYTFEFNDDGWRRKILDSGYRYQNTGGTLVLNAVDGKGTPVSTPILLDGSGKKLADGADPIFNETKVYKERSFSGLNLTPDMVPHN